MNKVIAAYLLAVALKWTYEALDAGWVGYWKAQRLEPFAPSSVCNRTARRSADIISTHVTKAAQDSDWHPAFAPFAYPHNNDDTKRDQKSP